MSIIHVDDQKCLAKLGGQTTPRGKSILEDVSVFAFNWNNSDNRVKRGVMQCNQSCGVYTGLSVCPLYHYITSKQELSLFSCCNRASDYTYFKRVINASKIVVKTATKTVKIQSESSFRFSTPLKIVYMQSFLKLEKMTIANKFRVNPIYYSDYSDTILC